MKIRAHTDWPKGQIKCIQHTSAVLLDNPWGDPVQRDLYVYLPPGYCENECYPVYWDLAAYTNSGPGHIGWRNHGENIPQRLDRLIAAEQMGPIVTVFPDCYTSLGGNQYLNSTGVGRYEDYLLTELLPLVESRFSVRSDAAGRAIFGKSSGAYGALMQSIRHPDIWGAAACHSGDMFFDLVYRSDFPTVCKVLARKKYDIPRFMSDFWNSKQPGGDEFHTMMILCMAATYDPVDPELTTNNLPFRLPFDLETCKLDPDLWSMWLRFDPVEMPDSRLQSLKALKGLYLDVGYRDQYHIHLGNRRFHKRLLDMDINHHYDEFDGTHSGIDHRLDISLPWMYEKLSESS